MSLSALRSICSVLLLALFLAALWMAGCGSGEVESRPPLTEGWEPLFDGETLEGWKATQFGGEGPVEVRDGAILLGRGEMLTGITLTGDFPTSNYEVSMEAMRVQGNDFFCGLTFPVDDSFCSLILGGWGGSVVGISSIDGLDASENETSRAVSFERGRWYRVRLRVSGSRIEGWLDDEQIVNLRTEGVSLSTRPEVLLSRPFGIASYQTRAALRNIAVRRIPG